MSEENKEVQVSELETLFVIEKQITVGKSPVKIKQVTLGDLPKIIEVVVKVMPTEKGKKFDIKEASMKLAKDHFEDVVYIISSLTDIDKEKVKTLNLAAAGLVVAAILTENVDFLYQHVLPAFKGLTDKINEKETSKAGSGKSKN